ncbi:MAG: hypothetical protein V2A56_12640 [bacterium]
MIDGIGKAGAAGPLGQKPIDPTPPTDAEKAREIEQNVPAETGKDSARISDSAAEIARYQEMARLHREAYGSADRTKKLAEVKKRIQESFYDQPQVLDKIAGGIAKTVQGSTDETEVERAQRRSEEGFYDRPEVIDRTAENIVREVLPGIQREPGRG